MKLKILSVLVFIGVNLTLAYNWVPHWGFDSMYAKMNTNQAQVNSSDILVVGTSRTHFGFLPNEFEANFQGHSVYNFGFEGIINPQIYQVVEEALKKDSCKILLVEFSNVSYPIQNNLNTGQFLFWMDVNKSSFWVDYFSSDGCQPNGEYAINIGRSLLSKNVNLGLGKDWLEFLYQNPANVYSGKEEKGFVDMDDLTKVDQNKVLVREEFLSDTSILAQRAQDIQEAKRSAEQSGDYCQTYFDFLYQYIEQAKEQNIQLIYFMPPLIEEPNEVFELYNQLPEANRLDLSSPSEFPEFYQLKNVFDKGHLNRKGAKLYSKAFAQKLKAHIEKHELEAFLK